MTFFSYSCVFLPCPVIGPEMSTIFLTCVSSANATFAVPNTAETIRSANMSPRQEQWNLFEWRRKLIVALSLSDDTRSKRHCGVDSSELQQFRTSASISPEALASNNVHQC